MKATTIGLISKKATLYLQHNFFVHFFAVLLQDYNVKLSETFCCYFLFFSFSCSGAPQRMLFYLHDGTISRASRIMRFFPANYALLFGELCTQNPELCENYANCTDNIFKQKFLMFQFSKLANQAETSNKHLITGPKAVCR